MRQSIYWPTVYAFLENVSVRECVLDACKRNGVDTPVELEIPAFESNGNSGSVIGALDLIQPDNLDEHDVEHLGKCLAIIEFLKTGKKFEAAKKEPTEEPNKKAPISSKKKAVDGKPAKEKAVKAKSPSPVPAEEPATDAVQENSDVVQKDLVEDAGSDLKSEDAPAE